MYLLTFRPLCHLFAVPVFPCDRIIIWMKAVAGLSRDADRWTVLKEPLHCWHHHFHSDHKQWRHYEFTNRPLLSDASSFLSLTWQRMEILKESTSLLYSSNFNLSQLPFPFLNDMLFSINFKQSQSRFLGLRLYSFKIRRAEHLMEK